MYDTKGENVNVLFITFAKLSPPAKKINKGIKNNQIQWPGCWLNFLGLGDNKQAFFYYFISHAVRWCSPVINSSTYRVLCDPVRQPI